MKVGLIQYNPVWEDKKANHKQLEALLEDGAVDTSLLIFPEMSLTGFTMASLKHAEQLDGETVQFFSSIARNFDCHVIAGIIEAASPLPHNSLIHLKPDGNLVSTYRKIHTISYYSEHQHYQKGTEPTITAVEHIKIGLSICFDLRFPELYRSYIDQKVHAMINIANWPAARAQHWEALLRARAIENQCYMIGVNRIGTDDNIQFDGHSTIIDPLGNELIMKEKKEGVFTVDIFAEMVAEVRESFPVLNLRVI